MVAGKITVRTNDAEVSSGNVITTAGLGFIATALMWSGMADQASALGLTTQQWLYPLFGAVGVGGTLTTTVTTAVASGATSLAVASSAGFKGGLYNPTFFSLDGNTYQVASVSANTLTLTTPLAVAAAVGDVLTITTSASDQYLQSEATRTTVAGGAASNDQVQWTFDIGATAAPIVITECGLFAASTGTTYTDTLTASVGAGSSTLPVYGPGASYIGQLVQVDSGNTAEIVEVTAVGLTSLTTTPLQFAHNMSAGIISVAPAMVNHAFVPPITKGAGQMATIIMQITL